MLNHRVVTSQPLRVAVAHYRLFCFSLNNKAPVPFDSSSDGSLNKSTDRSVKETEDNDETLRKEIHRNTFYYQTMQMQIRNQEFKRLEKRLDISNRLLQKYKEGKTLSDDDKRQQKMLLEAQKEREKEREKEKEKKKDVKEGVELLFQKIGKIHAQS